MFSGHINDNHYGYNMNLLCSLSGLLKKKLKSQIFTTLKKTYIDHTGFRPNLISETIKINLLTN